MNTQQTLAANDLTLLRIEQAKMLKERVAGSCRIVEFIVFYTSIMIGFVHSIQSGLLWFGLGTVMVLVTYVYPKLFFPGDITSHNVVQFLRGHCTVSAATGAVWSGYSIFLLNYNDYFTLFAGATLVCSITLGGVVPRSAYRATYIALASTAVLPYGAYISLTAPNAIAFLGIGLIVYFFFLMFVSARVELDIRETIASQNARQLNELILERNEVYREANAEKMRFMAGVSHDLAQPLHAQGLFIEGMRKKIESEELHALLDQIGDCWQSQLSMLRELSEVSRLEHGQSTVIWQSLSLAEECRTAAAQVQRRYRQAATLVEELEDCEATSDSALLGRILRNLIANALKFTPESGKVILRCRPSDCGAIIEIEDNGPGISDSDRARIWDEFVQLKSNAVESPPHKQPAAYSAVTNSGLGLSIVKRLSDRLGITISLHSVEGEGTRFTLTLDENNARESAARQEIMRTSTFPEDPLVVVVDDDVAVLEATKTALTAWNCRVMAGRSVNSVLEFLGNTEEIPDLIIVDYHIGSENGLDAIRMLREECNDDIPAVVISSAVMDPSKADDMKGVVSLSKPLDPKSIWLLIRERLHIERA